MHATYKAALSGTLGALGIVLRSFYLEITANVQLTPGMIPPALAGMLMGLEGGFITGLIVGVYGALFSGEFPLIPLAGNMLLGIGPGIIYEIVDDRHTSLKSILYVLLTGFLGGFAPTFLFLLVLVPPAIAAPSALFDLTNAIIAGIIGVIIWLLIRNWSSAYSLFKRDHKNESRKNEENKSLNSRGKIHKNIYR
ncbi:MAG: ECF transporter S component [Candidatus Hodarchaeota archaeon]